MPTEDIVIEGNAQQAASWTIPLSGGFKVESVYATIDTSGGDASPELVIANAEGRVIATKAQQGVLNAGGQESATWALRLADEQAAASGGDYTFVAEAIPTPGNAFQFPAVPQDARHLVIEMEYGGTAEPLVQFNGDGGANYRTIVQTVQDFNGVVTQTATATMPNNNGIHLLGAASSTNRAQVTIKIPYYRLSLPLGFRDRGLLAEIALYDNNAVSVVNLVRRANIAGFWHGGPFPDVLAPPITSITISTLAGLGGRASLYKVK